MSESIQRTPVAGPATLPTAAAPVAQPPLTGPATLDPQAAPAPPTAQSPPAASQSPPASSALPSAAPELAVRRFDESRRPTLTPDRPTMDLSEALAPGWFLVLFAAAFLALSYLLSVFLADLVLAFMLVGVFRSFFERTRRSLGGRSWLASALTTSVIGVLVVGPASWLLLTIAKEARSVYTASQNAFSEDWLLHHAQGRAAVRRVRDLIEGLGLHVSPGDVQGAISHAANSVKDVVSQRASDLLSNAFSSLLHFFIVGLIVFYMFVDGERLRRFAFRLSPLPDDEDALLTAKFTAVARAILVGSGISASVQGALGALSFVAVGLPSAVLWGAIMTLLGFLPVFGPLFVVTPAALYLWLDGRMEAAILFFCFNALAHLVVENIVKARLIGVHMRLHDLLVFLSILGGLAAFGVMGIIYGPLIVTIFMTLAEFYERHYQRVMARAFARRME